MLHLRLYSSWKFRRYVRWKYLTDWDMRRRPFTVYPSTGIPMFVRNLGVYIYILGPLPAPQKPEKHRKHHARHASEWNYSVWHGFYISFAPDLSHVLTKLSFICQLCSTPFNAVFQSKDSANGFLRVEQIFFPRAFRSACASFTPHMLHSRLYLAPLTEGHPLFIHDDGCGIPVGTAMESHRYTDWCIGQIVVQKCCTKSLCVHGISAVWDSTISALCS